LKLNGEPVIKGTFPGRMYPHSLEECTHIPWKNINNRNTIYNRNKFIKEIQPSLAWIENLPTEKSYIK
jgi:hypothetical protein